MPIRLLLTQSHQEHRGGDCGAGRVGRGWDAKKDSIRMHHLRMCHAHHGSRTPQMQAGGLARCAGHLKVSTPWPSVSVSG